MITTSIVLVILIIVDISIIHELSKLEDHFQVTLRATSRLCDAFKKHIQEEAHNDKRTSD